MSAGAFGAAWVFRDRSDWEDFLALVDSHLYRVSPPQEPKRILSGKPFWITVLDVFLLAVAIALWNGLWNL